MATNDARNPVKTVQTALEIIEVVQERGSIGVTELSEELGLSKGPTHCHLSTLRQNGYVVKDGSKYKLGLRFIDVAHHVRNRNEIYDLVEDEVDRLAEKSGEMALFTVEEQNQGVCLYKARGADAVQTELYVGYYNALYHTAVGKAILACKSPEKIEQYLADTDLEALTDKTITSPQALRSELEEIRETGFAYNKEESINGLTGVGAPIRNQDGTIYGAIGVIGPASRMSEDRLDEVAEMLYHAVNVVEINATSL
ncbi:transcriptional regulator, IclR family [Halogranum amylolyticum]|uniref:Transcriptional regulator, IclR family n=1 Tax=Halogranum amylolyticum TaxID=660520 RepID=A0A1H8UHM7_9EURY|nr:IclR family transcriptional regulator [Halogranum amylolyticum]SEP02720.1 transcriptional regulator, IclR family [Halogranum amylolyticum]